MHDEPATWTTIRRAVEGELWSHVPKPARLQMVASAFGAEPRWPPDLTDAVHDERLILDPKSVRAERDDLRARLERLAKGDTP